MRLNAGLVEASRLKKIELFNELPDEALELLAERAQSASADEVGPGDVIGEAGVVRHPLRNATVVATSPLRALVIAHSDIKQVRREHPDFDERLQAVMEERIS
jgi:CRP-like cAMP-binding protein